MGGRRRIFFSKFRDRRRRARAVGQMAGASTQQLEVVLDGRMADLERLMGLTAVGGGPADDNFDGGIEPEDEADGRTAVVYDDCDALLSPGVAPGGSHGLIAQLEAMADQLEGESGEPERGIRAQIAQLRAVLQGQSAAVAAEAERLAAVPAEEAISLAKKDAGAVLQSIEQDLAKFDETLASDAGVAQMLGNLLRDNDAITAGLLHEGDLQDDTGEEVLSAQA